MRAKTKKNVENELNGAIIHQCRCMCVCVDSYTFATLECEKIRRQVPIPRSMECCNIPVAKKIENFEFNELGTRFRFQFSPFRIDSQTLNAVE